MTDSATWTKGAIERVWGNINRCASTDSCVTELHEFYCLVRNNGILLASVEQLAQANPDVSIEAWIGGKSGTVKPPLEKQKRALLGFQVLSDAFQQYETNGIDISVTLMHRAHRLLGISRGPYLQMMMGLVDVLIRPLYEFLIERISQLPSGISPGTRDGSSDPGLHFTCVSNGLLDESELRVFMEAYEAYQVLAFTPCVLACRAVYEHMAFRKANIEGISVRANSKLQTVTDTLVENDCLTEISKATAEIIRLLGNDAAHFLDNKVIKHTALSALQGVDDIAVIWFSVAAVGDEGKKENESD